MTLSMRLFCLFGLLALIFTFVSCGFDKKLTPENAAGLNDAFLCSTGALPSKATPGQKSMIQQLIRALKGDYHAAPLNITYPISGSLFPPEIVAPMFLWEETVEHGGIWLITITFQNDSTRLYVPTTSPTVPPLVIDSACISPTNTLPQPIASRNWTPPPVLWEFIKKKSMQQEAVFHIYGFNIDDMPQSVSKGTVRLTTSGDSVGAPIFYRDVPLMPSINETGKIMPLAKSAVKLVTWRLRDISKPESRLMLADMPTCANCHSFSRDGKWMGMDIDGPNFDKGMYTVSPVEKRMVLRHTDFLSWNYDFNQKSKGKRTIGFLSRISPDGRHVVTTVNEEVYVANYLNHKYLHVFFPTKGVLAVYSKKTGSIALLPGADDSAFVHCDPVWSPDGKYIIFARARARPAAYREGTLKAPDRANAPEEIKMQYSLYCLPFNNGMGGKAKAVEGASNNGMSNNFPKVSPDGKFIVFVKNRNGQLLRPDSKLWIVPFQGGRARLMKCNTDEMNSWHSFSPNSRWMIFASKANTFYTQMFLTHIDEEGNDSPPILIPNSTADNRAVNLPEFVNVAYDAFTGIEALALRPFRNTQQADILYKKGKHQAAIAELEKALLEDMGPRFRSEVLINLGGLLKDYDKAVGYLKEAIALAPDYKIAYYNLGIKYQHQKKDREAVTAYKKVLELDPGDVDARVKLAWIYMLSKVPSIHDTATAVRLAEKADALANGKNIMALQALAAAYSEAGRFADAVNITDLAIAESRKGKDPDGAAFLEKIKSMYMKKIPVSRIE
jgi:tetratricopeptide (TPR) repeat protein